MYRVLLGLGLVTSTAACAVGAFAFHRLSLLDPEHAGGVATLALALLGPSLAITGALRSRGELAAGGIAAVMASLAIAIVGAILALLIFVATPSL